MRDVDLYCDPALWRARLGRQLIIGHRGMPGDGVENRIEAFLTALKLGADGIECDVQITGDGVPVIAHDQSLQRTTGRSGLIAESTAAELTALGLPTLAAVLEALPTTALLNLELKDPRFVRPGLARLVVDVVQARAAQGHVVFSSFNPATLRTLRRIDRRFAAGLLTSPRLPGGAWLRWLAKATGVHPHAAQLTTEFVQAARRRGLSIMVWGDRDEVDLTRILHMDIDALITDRVAAAVATAPSSRH